MGSSAKILQNQFKELTKNPVAGFRVGLADDNIYEWDVTLIGAPGTLFEGGLFKAKLKFPQDYPFNPPKFAFKSEFYHPNVYTDGNLCISILHPPVDDPMSGERPEERWNPTQSVESILVSVISLLSDPNISSPANVDAAVVYRKDPQRYRSIVRGLVEKSRMEAPVSGEMPSLDEFHKPAGPKPAAEPQEDDINWYDDQDEEDMLDLDASADDEEEQEEEEEEEGGDDA